MFQVRRGPVGIGVSTLASCARTSAFPVGRATQTCRRCPGGGLARTEDEEPLLVPVRTRPVRGPSSAHPLARSRWRPWVPLARRDVLDEDADRRLAHRAVAGRGAHSRPPRARLARAGG